MNKMPIFRWSGEYFGFISNNYLFDANGNYIGWIEEDGSVWNEDGSYLGELVEGSYILRKSNKIEPIPKVSKIPPIPPIPPIPKINRVGKIPRIGWEDALDKFKDKA